MTEPRPAYGVAASPITAWATSLRVGGWRYGLTRLLTYPKLPWIPLVVLPVTHRLRASRGLGMLSIHSVPIECECRWGERAIEVPFATRLLEEANRRGLRVLEVGNVLGPPRDRRTVVDKYEHGAGIVSEDILSFRAEKKFDFIVSVSTLEHVGFDEALERPGSFRAAVKHLYDDLLVPGGRLVFTVPLGYRDEVDRYLTCPDIANLSVVRLDRKSWLNDWTVGSVDSPVRPYAFEEHTARSVAFCTAEKPAMQG